MFFIGIIGTVLALKMNNYVNNFPSTGGIFVFIRFPQKSGISPVLGEKIHNFLIFHHLFKKNLDKTNKWYILIICMKFFTQNKNYRFLALCLNCQNQERKKHISPALGKSPRNEKCHFPSTGEIPQCWEPPDCVWDNSILF